MLNCLFGQKIKLGYLLISMSLVVAGSTCPLIENQTEVVTHSNES